jgi:alpha-tubulin suppressor-like RCC1 family protein
VKIFACPVGRGRRRGRRGRAPVLLLGLLTVALGVPASAAANHVVAWGGDEYGQLGNGVKEPAGPPAFVQGLVEPVAVAAGHHDSFALLGNGTVEAWGSNESGALGDGTEGGTSAVPVAVKGLTEVTQVAAGSNYALALLRNGTVMSWGYNQFGQLGDGLEASSSVPVQVKGLTEVTQISAGRRFALALLRDGTVRMWGYNGPANEGGELGIGTNIGPEICPFGNHETTYCSRTPVKPIELSGVTAVSGGDTHSLALLGNGEVESWGANSFGELCLGTKAKTGSHKHRSYVPRHVPGLTGAAGVAAGNKYSLVLLRNGTALGCGKNKHGELGDGSYKTKKSPSPVAGLTGAVAISASAGEEAGEDHSLALLSDGKVMGWGSNSTKQLGVGIPAKIDAPVQLPGLSAIKSISASGTAHSLALTGE